MKIGLVVVIGLALLMSLSGCKSKEAWLEGSWSSGAFKVSADKMPTNLSETEQMQLQFAIEHGFNITFNDQRDFQLSLAGSLIQGKAVWEGDTLNLQPNGGNGLTLFKFKREGNDLVLVTKSATGEPIRLTKNN